MGISSAVRLAAWMPAIRATSNGSPLGFCGSARKHLAAHGNKCIGFRLPQCGTLARHVDHRGASGWRRSATVSLGLLLDFAMRLRQQHRYGLSRLELLAIGRYHNVAVRFRDRHQVARSLPAHPFDFRLRVRTAQSAGKKSRQSGPGGERFLQARLHKRQRLDVAPPSASSTGRTNNWNVTMVDTGFPGSPKNGVVLPSQRDLSEDHRLARLNRHAGEEEFCAQRRQHLFHQVVLAHRDAAGQQQQIASRALAQQKRQVVWLVDAPPAASWLRRRPRKLAPPANSCWSCESRWVRAAD